LSRQKSKIIYGAREKKQKTETNKQQSRQQLKEEYLPVQWIIAKYPEDYGPK